MTPLIYVVMPVGSDARYLQRRAAIEQAIGDLGFATHFPADALHHKVAFDLEQTRRDLRRARLVVADLTLERPSCYYEVGLAQALGRRVQLFAERGTPIHQAHHRDRTIFYDSFEELGARLHDVLVPLRVRVRQPVAR
jgi:hypothetical protein